MLEPSPRLAAYLDRIGWTAPVAPNLATLAGLQRAHVRGGVGAFYAAALGLWALAFWLLRGDWIALLALLPMAGHLAWQILTLNPENGEDALAKFRSNRFAGLLLAAACGVVGNTGG